VLASTRETEALFCTGGSSTACKVVVALYPLDPLSLALKKERGEGGDIYHKISTNAVRQQRIQ